MRLPIYKIIHADVFKGIQELPDGSIHLVVSSPPYYAQRDYKADGQLGHEATSEEYCNTMAQVFINLIPKLHPSGGVMAINLGDSYNGSNGAGSQGVRSMLPYKDQGALVKNDTNYKDRDLMNVPHRVYEKIRKAGLYWRSSMVWAKTNGSPESVYGVRWVRHRIKTASAEEKFGSWIGVDHSDTGAKNRVSSGNAKRQAKWELCPGCKKCESTKGFILSWGSGRPTSAYEPIGLLTTSKYYWDNEAVRTAYAPSSNSRRKYGLGSFGAGDTKMTKTVTRGAIDYEFAGANARNVQEVYDNEEVLRWLAREYPELYVEYMQYKTEATDILKLPTAMFRESHFATFNPKLPEFFIKAATSEYGVCASCGAPWARMMEEVGKVMEGVNSRTADVNGYSESSALRGNGVAVYKTVGWMPTCKCGTEERMPAVVFDPFAGAGTTLMEANRLVRDGWGIELNGEYKEMAEKRIVDDAPLFYLPGMEPETESKPVSDFEKAMLELADEESNQRSQGQDSQAE